MMNKLAALLAVTSGCATADVDGAFHLTGRLADPSAITHVVGWNTATGEHVAIDLKADGLADGEFDLALVPGGTWGVTFADASQSGMAMRVATLAADGLDAFNPQAAGTADLGTITARDGRAQGTLASADLIAALGLDSDTAERMGRIDDLALRYANPDIDNDGVIDALQGRVFSLVLGGKYRMQRESRELDIADLVRGTQPSSLRYLGTSIMTQAPQTMNLADARFTFDEPFFGAAGGPDTEMVAAGTPIGPPHVKFGDPGSRAVGVVASAAHNAPSGTYDIDFGDGMLTFSDVHVPRTSILEAATDHAVPVLRVRPVVAGCTYDCAIQSIELAWRRQFAFGWVDAAAPSDARLDIVADLNGKHYTFGADLGRRASIAWQDMPVRGTGLANYELAYISSGGLCYVAVTYESELGMRMTSQVVNPACTH